MTLKKYIAPAVLIFALTGCGETNTDSAVKPSLSANSSLQQKTLENDANDSTPSDKISGKDLFTGAQQQSRPESISINDQKYSAGNQDNNENNQPFSPSGGVAVDVSSVDDQFSEEAEAIFNGDHYVEPKQKELSADAKAVIEAIDLHELENGNYQSHE